MERFFFSNFFQIYFIFKLILYLRVVKYKALPIQKSLVRFD